jgi:hypothetical protein
VSTAVTVNALVEGLTDHEWAAFEHALSDR